jgi:hypothetical protein
MQSPDHRMKMARILRFNTVCYQALRRIRLSFGTTLAQPRTACGESDTAAEATGADHLG